jgi:alkyl hydroperoxide reductase subunit AhpC
VADSNPEGAVARAYGVYLERKEMSGWALFIIDERGTIRWSRVYPGPVNPGVDGVLCALECVGTTEDTTLRQADEEGEA